MKKRKISTKLVLWLFSVTVVIVLLTGALIALSTYRNEMQDYSDAVLSYAKTASELIDGDRIAAYEKTGVTDEYFDQIQSFFTSSVKETNLLYYYVFVPYEDDLMYIWDSDATEEEPPLGYREEYMKDGGKEAVEAIYRRDPPEKMKLTKDKTYGYIASAFYPVFNSAGEPVAVVGVDMSMPDIIRKITESVAILVLSVLVITGLSAAAMYISLRRDLVVPLGKLNSAAKETVENIDRERELELDIHTGDELETLASSFDRMYRELRDYIKENAAITANQERIETELSLATKIQADMLPNVFPAFPDRCDFDIYASMTPAKEVGGDFYDFFLVDDDHLALVMADVSGKGVPAALFMMMAMIMIRNQALSGKSPEDVLVSVNDQICRNNREQLFVTVWLGILELSTGKLIASNAGHEKPIIKHADGDYEMIMDKHGLVVGAMGGIRYRSYELQLYPGSRLFLYTDGLMEAADESEGIFGSERALETLNRAKDASPQALLEYVKSEVKRFEGSAPRFDDLTLLCLEYNGQAKPDGDPENDRK